VLDLSHLKEIPDPLGDPARTLSAPSPSARPPPVDAARPQLPAPDRFQSARQRRRTMLVCISWWLGQLALWGVRPDLPSLSTGYLVLLVVLPALMAAVCSIAALAPGRLGLGASRSLLVSLAAASPLAFWLVAFTAPAPVGLATTRSPLEAALVCSGLLLGWMSVPLWATTRALRGAFAASAAWRSALGALSVGLCAAATLNLHCANSDRWHIALAHGTPIALAALGGAFVLTRWLRS
jgi:hypothetical protein